ncbi:hypothetical protein [Caenispirillum bisanense]|uniref:Ricin-type beta-trefoil lectin domain-containing protein n=1 Tax=Caenispirillum bisanense TaxID=414052 RepID=A0A286GST4_9PROT|nr:hypothetical protein [Caenispirillum bisanense]SOD98580.1 hypothetical protein SAMN05421508_10815 [Caenispirillum bisanense]
MKRLFLILLASTCLSAPLLAQSTPATPAAAPAATAQPGTAQPGTAQPGTTGTPTKPEDLVVEKVPMLTLPKVSVEVPENEPVPLDMTLKEVPGAEPELLDGVTAKAFTRYVTVEGDRIGQLVLTAVTKDEKVEALPHELFVSQFEIKAAPVLPTAEEVTVEGDQETMIAALKRLQEEEEKEDDEKEEKDNRDNKDGRDGKSGGSGTSSNPDAAGYKTPDKLEQAKTDGEDFDPGPVPEVEITADGCPIRVDLAQGVAIQQSRVIMTTGSTTETEPCADGATRFPIERTSAGCEDIVNLSAGYATPTFRLTYTGPDGRETRVAECQPDPERSFPIEEDEAGCAVQQDDVNQTYVRLQRLIYRDANNATVVVQDCQPIETRRVLTQGCDIRVDLDQGMAIQQIRTETVGEDGTSSEQCRDGTTRYPLLWSSLSCPDRIDLTARTATAQRRLYYVGPTGREVEVKACEDHPEQVFPIEEDRTVCPHFVDYDGLTVVEQGQLLYRDAENETIVVRDCAPAEGATPVPLEETAEGCTIRHDFTAGRSWRQTKLVYHMGDLTYQAGDCIDSATWYPQVRLYETAAGQEICPPVVDTAGKRITRASRVQITGDGKPEFITECQPDTASSALIATTDGCDNPGTWRHDLSAGQSYGQERFYYSRQDGRREYVTACQPSSATYPHQIEIAGWQNHDEQRFAYRLSTVYISTPQGRHDLLVAEVLPGTEQHPYVLEREVVTQTDQIYYDGCTRFAKTEKSEIWRRPDGSEYTRPMGPGAPANLGGACNTQQPSDPGQWTLVSVQPWRHECRSAVQWMDGDNRQHSACTAFYAFHAAQYQGTLTTVREDGTPMSSSTATKWETLVLQTSCSQSSETSGSCASYSQSWSPAAPPPPYGAQPNYEFPQQHALGLPNPNRNQPQTSSIAAWLAELGW